MVNNYYGYIGIALESIKSNKFPESFSLTSFFLIIISSLCMIFLFKSSPSTIRIGN